MQKELKALHKNKTYLVKFPKGQKIISCKWVYKIKQYNNDQIKRYHCIGNKETC